MTMVQDGQEGRTWKSGDQLEDDRNDPGKKCQGSEDMMSMQSM